MQLHQPLEKRAKSLRRTKSQMTNADKTRAVVILYRHLEHDLTTGNNATVNKVITRFKNYKLISSNVSDGLKVESPRTLCF